MRGLEARTCSALSTAVLAVIPLVLAGGTVTMYRAIVPIRAGTGGYDYDPAYAYLLNGIGVIQGHTPGHIDHPGTPMQVLVGVIAYLKRALAALFEVPAKDFNRAVLADPEQYLWAVSVTLLLLNATAIGYLGHRIHFASGSLLLALLAQSCFGLLGKLMPRLLYVSPEALVIFAVALATARLADVWFSNDGAIPNVSGLAVSTAFFLALSATAKITSLPLVLLLATIPTRRAKIAGAISFLVFSLIFLSPVFSKLLSIWTRWLGIFQHSGKFGTGPQDIIDLEKVMPRLASLAEHQPLLFVSIAASCLVAIIGVVRHQRRTAVCGVVLVGTQLTQLLMVLKHFGRHYTIPSLTLAPLVLAWSLRRSLGDLVGRRSEAVAAGLGLLLVLRVLVMDSQAYLDQLRLADRDRNRDLQRMSAVIGAYPDAVVVGAYRVRNEGFALHFGLGYVQGRFQRELSRSLAQPLSYSRWNGMLFSPQQGWLPLSHLNTIIDRGQVVLMVLPDDLTLSGIQGKTLLEIPGQERIVKVDAVAP